MAVVAPTPITALPTPPVLSDLDTFSSRTDAFINALPTFRSESNAVASNVYDNATEAAAKATEATAQAVVATSAVASTGATLWAVGTSYSPGNMVYSPLSHQTYRRVASTGSGGVDPAKAAPSVWMPTNTIIPGPMIYLDSLYGAFTYV